MHMIDNLGGRLGSFDRLEKELAAGRSVVELRPRDRRRRLLRRAPSRRARRRLTPRSTSARASRTRAPARSDQDRVVLILDDGDSWTAIGSPRTPGSRREIARAWGNERFGDPNPHEDFCLGVAARRRLVGLGPAPPLHRRRRRARRASTSTRRVAIEIWVDARGPRAGAESVARRCSLLDPRRRTSHSRYVDARAHWPRTTPPSCASTLARAGARSRTSSARRSASRRERAPELGGLLFSPRRDLARASAIAGPSASCRRSAARRSATCRSATAAATLDPWPLGVPELTVHADGRRVESASTDEAAMHAAPRCRAVVADRTTLALPDGGPRHPAHDALERPVARRKVRKNRADRAAPTLGARAAVSWSVDGEGHREADPPALADLVPDGRAPAGHGARDPAGRRGLQRA